MERLALALWGEELPGNARRSVQTYVTRLRRALGRGAIRTMPDGYRLETGPDRVDVLRFRRLLAEAGRSRGKAAEPALMEEANGLWRGTPFEDIDSDWLREAVSPPLLELHLSAVERRADLRLAAGPPGEMLVELTEPAHRHPLREPLWRRLLLALGRCGRQAEALALYERLRRRLAEELGTSPSPELRRIHTRLLQDGMSPVRGRPAPKVAVFSGRTGVLDRAGRLVEDGERFARVCVISETGGPWPAFLALVRAQE